MDVNIDSVRTVDLTIETWPQVSRMENVDSGRRRRFSNEAKLATWRRVIPPRIWSRQQHDAMGSHAFSETIGVNPHVRDGSAMAGGVKGLFLHLFGPGASHSGCCADKSLTAQIGLLEVVSANGRRVIVGRVVDVEALLRILHGLEAQQSFRSEAISALYFEMMPL